MTWDSVLSRWSTKTWPSKMQPASWISSTKMQRPSTESTARRSEHPSVATDFATSCHLIKNSHKPTPKYNRLKSIKKLLLNRIIIILSLTLVQTQTQLTMKTRKCKKKWQMILRNINWVVNRWHRRNLRCARCPKERAKLKALYCSRSWSKIDRYQ